MVASAEKSVWCLSALALSITATSVWGQTDQDSEAPFITVTSPRLERNLYDTPAAVSVTAAPDIREGQQRLQLDESLNTVPGPVFPEPLQFRPEPAAIDPWFWRPGALWYSRHPHSGGRDSLHPAGRAIPD